MQIKDLIYSQRKKLGLTLEEVGNYVGVGKSTVRKWETGDIENMRRDKISLLSTILEINPVLFITGFDNIEHNSIKSSLPPDEENLLTDFRKLNATGKNKIIEYINDIVDSGKYDILSNEDNAQDVG